MRRHLALFAVATLALTGCSEPREESSVEVTPPPVLDVPAQTQFHQAFKSVLGDDAVIATGQPAIEALTSATIEIENMSPEPANCAGVLDADAYTTQDIAVGFSTQQDEETADGAHSAETVVAADFDTADAAATYFGARTQAWQDCESVDLTINDTNVLTLNYTTDSFAAAESLDIPADLLAADQDLILRSAGELSGAFESSDAMIPGPGSLPDYVISPDQVPESEPENIAVTSTTLVARFGTQVFWVTVEPSSNADQAVATLTAVLEAVRQEQ